MTTFWGIAEPEQLAALAKFVEEHANEMGIFGDQQARHRLAQQIWALFNEGVTAPADIRRRLDSGRP